MKGSEVKTWLLLLLAVAQTTTADYPEDTESGFQTGKEYVTFRDLDVILTCPESDSTEITWGPKNIVGDGTEGIIEDYTEDESLYYCQKKGDTVKHFFYVKAKVCKGCVEMNKGLVIAAMFGDILFTLGVILVIYACAKKKNSSPAPQRAAHSRQPSAPPPPEPDYQSLNQATRSRDIYAEAGRRAH
ncbi:T-cell surface glycoprotein CD3 epsilon chain-like [Astyanax mexicanus]|uniref:T-cell surface glycoprotein CD3 epsilon chain-like n=1 Tax=Astyanax mexicanus TaxID=7994 RepID=UPI0020CB2AF7|nr:T-cell surface glycoprotein CD3 epsilon chain-like [Astyanax mexicanus]